MSIAGTILDPALHAGQTGYGATRSDWVFWLSSQPVPAGLAAANIVCYEPGREIPVDTWIQGIPGIAVGKLAGTPASYPAIWKDGFGRPILSLEQASGNRIFHFYSHFDPEWNGLVWSPRFPILLEELMMGPASAAGQVSADSAASIALDRRVLDPEQIQPEFIPGGMVPSAGGAAGMPAVGGVTGLPAARRASSAAAMDLAPACWILIFLLFLAERILAYHSPKIKPYG